MNSQKNHTSLESNLRSGTKTKKCSYCWEMFPVQSHFQHEEACARKFAKSASKKAKKMSESLDSSVISDGKNPRDYKKCSICDETFHIRSMKKHTVICEKYYPLIKNGSECSMCSRQFLKIGMLYGHITRDHMDAVLEREKQGL